MEIMTLGTDWGYKPKLCDTCPNLERSQPDENGKTFVACDAKFGICVKTNRKVYTFTHGINY